jgi:hypothetical protein
MKNAKNKNKKEWRCLILIGNPKLLKTFGLLQFEIIAFEIEKQITI